MTSIEELFCDVDDFCQTFLPQCHRQLITTGQHRHQRASRMVLSEMMTILVAFLSSPVNYYSLQMRHADC